jgi:polyvinyl alcohol dehydrogenase (cytochrome)
MISTAWLSKNRREPLRRAFILSALLGAALPASATADWPVFGHDLANTRNGGAQGPTAREAAVLQRAWVFRSSHGDFTGTPVVAKRTLVAGTNLGLIVALDARTGKLKWSRQVGHPINGSAAIDRSAPGGPTVFIPVACLGQPRLLALSLATGAVRWQAILSRQAGADVYGSPIFWRRTVYIGTSGPGNDESRARGSVVALREATGQIKWRSYTVPPHHDGGGVWSTPAIDPARGRLYVGTGNAYHEPAARTTDSILILSASSGRILGHFQSTPGDVWELNAPANGPDWDFGASPNLFTDPHGRHLVGEGQKSGIYWALARSTMKPLWHRGVGPGSQADGGIGSTALAGNNIFGSDSVNGEVFALNRSGKLRWSSSDGGTLHVSPVAVGHGLIYSASSDGRLTIRRQSTGAVINVLSLGNPTFGGISLAGHAVYVAVGTGPPSPVLPLPSPSTQNGDGNGSIVAFGDTSGPGSGRFSLHFSSQLPGHSTGAHLVATVHRGARGEKPSALHSETLSLPPGARFDGQAVPACHASDDQIHLLGPAACPRSSEVGSGTLQTAMGTPVDPETADVTIFNWGRGTVPRAHPVDRLTSRSR